MLGKILITVGVTLITLNASNLKDIEPTKTTTKLEKIQEMKGSIINKGYTDIGSLYGTYSGKITVTSYEFNNMKSNKSEYGLSIKIKREKKYADSEKSSFIDYDEIKHLVKGIEYIEKIKKNPTKSKQFESSYKTKGGLSITLFNNSSNELSLAISVGTYGKESAYLQPTELNKFKELIVNGKKEIDSIK